MVVFLEQGRLTPRIRRHTRRRRMRRPMRRRDRAISIAGEGVSASDLTTRIPMRRHSHNSQTCCHCPGSGVRHCSILIITHIASVLARGISGRTTTVDWYSCCGQRSWKPGGRLAAEGRGAAAAIGTVAPSWLRSAIIGCGRVRRKLENRRRSSRL